MKPPTYKDAGVDLEVYRQSMARLPQLIQRTHTPRVLPWQNGFAGLFRLDFPGQPFARGYRQPVLVAGSDGVGTKLKLATLTGRHDTVGIDLVAMCVNDVICSGAEPLFFLDYVAMSHDDPDRLANIVDGISIGCQQAGCALLGGETAIMPDLYQPGDYDLAGFCVGVVEQDACLDGARISPGDVVIGIASNGIHSNGFSLVRKIVFEHAGLTCDDRVPFAELTVGEALLQPTLIYAPVIRALRSAELTANLHGIAHITGGGIQENLERILPDSASAQIRPDSWDCPPVFSWLQELGQVADEEMRRVFNLGIGLILVTAAHAADDILDAVVNAGYTATTIGQVETGIGNVTLETE